MKDFMKKMVGFSIGPIIGTIISFFTISLATYFINPAEYGKSAMFTLALSVFTVVAYWGLDNSYVRFYNEEQNKGKLFFNSIIFPLIITIFLSIFLILNPKMLSYILFDSDNYTMPIYMMAIMIPLLVIERFLLLTIRMEGKGVKYSIINIVIKLLIFIMSLIFVLKIRRDFLAVIYSNILGNILGDIILILTCKNDIKIDLKSYDEKLIKKLFKFGMPLVIASVIGWALNSMDKICLRYISNYEEIGYYNIAMKFANILLVLQSCFTTAWVPIAYKWFEEKKDEKYYTIVSNGIALIMSSIFIIILMVKNIIPILISSTYEKSIYIMPFLLFYPIMYTMSETTTLGIVFSKKSYFNILVSIVAISINMCFNLILIPKYGAKGAAIATGLSYIGFFWTRTMISRKLWYKFPIKKFVLITIVLVVIAYFNTFYNNFVQITILNVIGLLLMIFINIDTIKMILTKCLERKK